MCTHSNLIYSKLSIGMDARLDLVVNFERHEDVSIILLFRRSFDQHPVIVRFEKDQMTQDVCLFGISHPIHTNEQVYVEAWSHWPLKEPMCVFAASVFESASLIQYQGRVILDLKDTSSMSQASLTITSLIPNTNTKQQQQDLINDTSNTSRLKSQTDVYCESLTRAYKNKRPNAQSTWFTCVAFPHASIPLSCSVLNTTKSHVDPSGLDARHWENMLDIAQQHYGIDESNEMLTTYLCFMLSIPFCGFTYVSDYNRRSGGNKSPADVWNLLRSRPPSINDGSGCSFDCEDASLHILQSLTSISKISSLSSTMSKIKYMVTDVYDKWMVIGAIRVSEDEYTPHAYVCMRSKDSSYPTLCIEGTALTQGSYTPNTMIDTSFDKYSKLTKAESGMEKWLRDQINCTTPQSVVEHIKMYGDPILLINQSTGAHIVATQSRHTANDVSDKKSNMFDSNQIDDVRPVDIQLEWVQPSQLAHNGSTSIPIDGCACGRKVSECTKRYLYYIRPIVYQTYSKTILNSINRLYSGSKTLACRITIGGELDVIRLCVCPGLV